MEFDYSKLRGRIREKNLTLKELGKKINLSETSVNKKLMGKVYFKQNEMNSIIKVLDIPAEEISNYFFTFKVEKISSEEM